MDSILGLLINANTLQTLVILVAVISGYVFLNSKMDKKFAEQDKRIDAKFDEQDKRIDAKFAGQDKKFEAKFAEIDVKFAEQDKRIDAKFDEFYQKLKTNDFAHIHDAINALVFLIKRNGQINEQDEAYVNKQLVK